MSVTTYLELNRERQLSELVQFAAIPSISALSSHRDDIERCAEWLRDHMERIGLEDVCLLRCGGNPVVYGEWMHASAGAPTVLIYGHYDVQPADPHTSYGRRLRSCRRSATVRYTPEGSPTTRDRSSRFWPDSKRHWLTGAPLPAT